MNYFLCSEDEGSEDDDEEEVSCWFSFILLSDTERHSACPHRRTFENLTSKVQPVEEELLSTVLF